MIKRKSKFNVQTITKTALCVTVLCISSYLVIPLPFTPVVLSLHTVAVNLIGLILKPKQAGCALLAYIFMGLIGLPVFSGGTSGVGKLFGPTGGFYFGFLFAAIIIALYKGRNIGFVRYVLVTVGLGIPVQHFCAVLMMCLNNGFGIKSAVLTVSLPFIAGDVIKCIIASALGVAVNKALLERHK